MRRFLFLLHVKYELIFLIERDTLEMRYYNILKKKYSGIMKRKEEIEYLKETKFDLVFSNMVDACFVGVGHYLEIPLHIWISTGNLPDNYYNLLGRSIIKQREAFPSTFLMLKT